tara:strand:+ start:132 stop:1694 length:1563 start_codon:yes stop_codon:yes gene_type:complete
MSEEPKFLRILNGETKYMNLASLHKELLVTARDRSVQRESVWRTESDNKQGKYLSNVAIGYGKTALLHMINVAPNIKYLESICNSTKDQHYIDRLKEFLAEGKKWIHVDGGNRADTIIDWYENKVRLIAAIYTLCEEDEYGKRRSVGTVQLRDSMNREELLHSGGDYVKLVEQLEKQSFTIETYSELTEEDRRDLFKNLNDNIDLSDDEIRNCEISKICNDIRDLNDKYKGYFEKYGWVTEANARRYKFCAYLGYLNNFHTHANFSKCRSWSPKVLDKDYEGSTPAEENLPKFIEYFEKTFFPLVKIITDSKTHETDVDKNGKEIQVKIKDDKRYKNIGAPQRNTLIDLHIILTKIGKEGYSLATENRKPRLNDLFLAYKDWLHGKIKELDENGKLRTWTTNGTQEGKWLDLYGANTDPKIQHRLDAILTEFIPLLIEKGLIIKKDEERVFPYSFRQQLWTDQGHKCAVTGKYISLEDALNTDVTRMDHIIPHSQGGKTVYENAQLVFNTVNKEKSDQIW